MKKITMLFLCMLGIIGFSSAQTGNIRASKDNNDKMITNEPVIFLDEIRISNEEMQKVNPQDVAAIEVLKDSTALQKLGDEGKNGVIYITTVKHAHEKYIGFFKSISEEFAGIIETCNEETDFVYILNKKVLGAKPAGDLYFIDEKKLEDFKIINETELEEEYKIFNKKYGIVITTSQKN